MKIIHCQKPTICLVKKTYDVSLRAISNNYVSGICLHDFGKAAYIFVKLLGLESTTRLGHLKSHEELIAAQMSLGFHAICLRLMSGQSFLLSHSASHMGLK